MNRLAEQIPGVIVAILASDAPPGDVDDTARIQVTSQTAVGNSSVSSLAAFVARHSADWPLQGWSSGVTRMSPNGDAGLEDLRLMDWSNPTECLVIVTFQDSDRSYALRRMYNVGIRGLSPNILLQESN